MSQLKNFLLAPLVFVFVFGCLIFVCSIQLAHSTNSFQLHPPVEIVELTPEEKEALRLERKFASGRKFSLPVVHLATKQMDLVLKVNSLLLLVLNGFLLMQELLPILL